jgi:hypothetical protein
VEHIVIFQIPEDLTVYTVPALTQKSTQAATEYNTLLASMQADESLATQDNLGDLDALKAFTDAAKAEIDGRSASKAKLSEHAPLNVETAAVVEPIETVEPGTEEFSAPRVSEVAPLVPAIEGELVEPVSTFGTMRVAANVPHFGADSELATMEDLTKAFLSKTEGFGALAAMSHSSEPVSYQVAYIQRDYPAEFSVFNREDDDATLRKVVDETRLPGGSLLASLDRRRQELVKATPQIDAMVAATGWCAPSETLYDTCFQGVIDGLLDAPEVQARRGGIRHNQGIDFTGVYGSGTGFFNLTEAQVISGTSKTCIEIPCPSFVDDRLGVTGICITGNILQNRGYPEFVRDWMRAAMVVSAHQINSLQIADVVSGSTAVSLTANDPWISDASVTSQLLSAVEMALVDVKYRLRMARSATLDVVFPFWVLAQFRADLSRRNGGDYYAASQATDSEIVSWFSQRGARVQFVYDWQDAFATTDVVGAAGNAPGHATPIVQFPTGVKFLVYPSGTWVRAVNDVITLNAIYDSTKLVTNQNTQLFTETGWKMMRMCPVSRVYTINICPTGSTGAQRAVDCVTT